MPDLNELWDWLAYVCESDAYWIALPSLVGLFLACFTGWMELRLAGGRPTAVENEPSGATWAQLPSSSSSARVPIEVVSGTAVPISSVQRNSTPQRRY